MNPESTRASLLSRVRDPADQAAWGEFKAHYRELILRYARRQGLSAADAEDVCQMVMVRLVHAMPRFQYDPRRGRFHDYLYRVARNAISDFRACPELRTRTVVDDELLQRIAAVGETATDPVWEQEWVDHHLRTALVAVRLTSDPKSIAVFERLLTGASVEDAAAEFGMTVDAVHKVKQRVRDRVQLQIAAQIGDEDAFNR